MLSEEAWQELFAIRDKVAFQARNVDLYDYQKLPSNEIIKSVVERKGLVVPISWSRQSGKTESIVATVAFLMIFYQKLCKKFGFSYENKEFNIGIFAPQKQQAEEDFNRLKEYTKVFQSYGLSVEVSNGNTMKLSNKATCYSFTASINSHIESKTMHLIILEEAQDLMDFKVQNTIIPMGSNTRATIAFIGVGGYQRCMFHEMIQRGPAYIYDCEQVIKEKEKKFKETNNKNHLLYKGYVNQWRQKLTESAFKTQYLLQWILELGQYITEEQVMRLFKNYELPETVPKHRVCYAGIDWGKSVDSTVLTIIDDQARVIYWKEWLGDDYTNQTMEIVRLLQAKFAGVRKIYVDSSATQDQICDFFERILVNNGVMGSVERINFGTTKDFMMKHLDGMMRDTLVDEKTIRPAMLQLPEAWEGEEKSRFIHQMVNLQKKIRPNGQWDVRAPEDAQHHDDYCFVAGTKVRTEYGNVSIEKIQVGDKVWTRKGLKKVRNIMNRNVSIIKRLGLCGTPNHPFIIKRNEKEQVEQFINLKLNDITYIWNEKQSCIEEKPIIDILLQNDGNTEYTSGIIVNGKTHQNHFIDKCGKISLGQSQKDILFTTRMETQKTIVLKIWSVFHDLNINHFICVWKKQGQDQGKVFKKQLPLEKNRDIDGRKAQKEEHSEGRTIKNHWQLQKYIRTLVYNVKTVILRQGQQRQNSVPENAEKIIDEILAHWQHTTKIIGKERVYNLEIEDCNEYFANNILVHNCMSLGLACLAFSGSQTKPELFLA